VHPEESMELQIAKAILERLPATTAELLYWLSPKFNSIVVKSGLVFLFETRQIKYQGKYLVRDLGSIRAEHSGTSQLVDSTSESVKG
jgi:hypothetical protein